MYYTSYENEEAVTKYNMKVKILTYHLYDNGAIGDMGGTAINTLDIDETIFEDGYYTEAANELAMPNNLSDTFFVVTVNRKGSASNPTGYVVHKIKVNSTNNTCIHTSYKKSLESSYGYPSIVNGRTKFSADDQYIQMAGRAYSDEISFVIKIDTNTYTPINAYTFSGKQCINIPNTNKFIRLFNDGYGVKVTLRTIDFSETDVTAGAEKVVRIHSSTRWAAGYNIDVTNDGQYLIVGGRATDSSTSSFVGVCLIQKIYDASDNEMVSLEQIFEIYHEGYDLNFNTDSSSMMLYMEDIMKLYKITSEVDKSEIIAIKYKDNYFYKQVPEQLSAGQGDVRKGKTFIGWMGYPEEGTMEV